MELAIDERVPLGKADITAGNDRVRLRTLAQALPLCGLTLEVECDGDPTTQAMVTLYAASRQIGKTREST